MLKQLIDRSTQILWDLHLQSQIMESLTDFAASLESIRHLSGVSHYGHWQTDLTQANASFIDLIHGALRDFWGGPKLAKSELITLNVVQKEQNRHEGNQTKALQAVLTEAIERLKPEGERKLNTPEWILYNILELRFLQGKKVRDVTQTLFMSEPDFYRKQRIAIEAVAHQVQDMERSVLADQENPMSISDIAR